MTRVLAINGSYRPGGVTDQAVEATVAAVEALGGEAEIIFLRDTPIEFCLNCRACTQEPGGEPGECVRGDGMRELIEKIERADAYILASPTNLGAVTAIFKRFMERLVAYCYWPWERNTPHLRKVKTLKKKAVLISSCAAPGIFGRLFYGTHKQLTVTAQTIGARSVGTLFSGLVSKEARPKVSGRAAARASALAAKLIKA